MLTGNGYRLAVVHLHIRIHITYIFIFVGTGYNPVRTLLCSNISDLLAYFSTYYLYHLLCLLCTTCCTADKPAMARLGSAKDRIVCNEENRYV